MQGWAKDVGEELQMIFCIALSLLNYILLNLCHMSILRTAERYKIGHKRVQRR